MCTPGSRAVSLEHRPEEGAAACEVARDHPDTPGASGELGCVVVAQLTHFGLNLGATREQRLRARGIAQRPSRRGGEVPLERAGELEERAHALRRVRRRKFPKYSYAAVITASA